jgi:hypothetical protein
MENAKRSSQAAKAASSDPSGGSCFASGAGGRIFPRDSADMNR